MGKFFMFFGTRTLLFRDMRMGKGLEILKHESRIKKQIKIPE